MKPQQLIDGLRYLADQCPIDATMFRVPSAPASTNYAMRIGVSPRDVLDLLEHIKQLEERVVGHTPTELPAWSLQP